MLNLVDPFPSHSSRKLKVELVFTKEKVNLVSGLVTIASPIPSRIKERTLGSVGLPGLL